MTKRDNVIVCYVLVAIIQVVVRSEGIILGTIPTLLLFAGAFFAAKGLCNLWDKLRHK